MPTFALELSPELQQALARATVSLQRLGDREVLLVVADSLSKAKTVFQSLAQLAQDFHSKTASEVFVSSSNLSETLLLEALASSPNRQHRHEDLVQALSSFVKQLKRKQPPPKRKPFQASKPLSPKRRAGPQTKQNNRKRPVRPGLRGWNLL